MDEEEMLKRITRLLEQGCTMLASHHSCGAPLFRSRGQIVCPVCSFGEESAAEDTTSEMKAGPSGADQGKGAQEDRKEASSKEAPIYKARPDKDTSAQGQLSSEEADLRTAIFRKLRELAKGIEKEQDLDKLRKQFDCIEAALRALRSIEK